ncbi:MAG: hypothetical protein ABI867_18320 [Kofleriaceae bacterium]
MTFTTRSLFVLAALTAAGAAEAKPRRVVVLAFDGPSTLATAARSTVVNMVAEQYEVAPAKRWLDIRAAITRTNHGPSAWSKASKEAKVDVVVEGWVQDEARTKILSLVVTDASNGRELERISVKLPAAGFTDSVNRTLKDNLDDRFDSIDSLTDSTEPTYAPYNPKPREGLTGKESQGPAPATLGPDPVPATPAPAPPAPEAAPKRVGMVELYPQPQDRPQVGEIIQQPPRRTSKFQFAAGFGYDSRSLTIGAENPEGVTQYASVPHKSLHLDASFYPFPTRAWDGIPSGVGFSFSIGHSLGSTVTFDDVDNEEIADYAINQSQWHAGVHYRVALNHSFAFDGEVAYGQNNYTITDASANFEVPDTSYSYLSAGGHIDLAITDHASVGFGGKYLHVLDSGDLSSTEWYGPGKSSGIQLEGGFVVPLPKDLFINTKLTYSRIKTSFDGVGVITEEEGVIDATDSTVGGTVTVGIKF